MNRRITIPQSWTLFSGAFLLSLLFFQFITGLLLALYHAPSTAEAFNSLFFLRTQVFLGNTLHSIHYWGARFLLFFTFFHGIQLLIERGYLRSRTQWIIGAIFLFLFLNQDLSGRLLPYSQRAYWETTRSMEALQFIPLWGSFLLYFTQSLHGLSNLTYIRFYAFHISWVPGLMAIFLIVHILTSIRKGVRTGISISLLKFPFILSMGEFLLLTMAILATFGVLWPPRHGTPADTLYPYPGASAVWYLRPFHKLATIIPSPLAGSILAILLLSLFLIPWIDGGRRPYLARAWGLFVTVLYFFLAFWG